MPPEGQNVLVTLADGSEFLAYWQDGQWWVGVEDNPSDTMLEDTIISWRWDS
jgi:hypothetical protein